MKNYQDSDYALNRYSAGIVYRFADRIVEVTLEDYVAENPCKTERDFLKLKALSDAIYLEYDRAENAQTKKNDSIHWMEDSRGNGAPSLEEDYIEACDRVRALKAFTLLFESGELTQKQERRFLMYIRDGLSTRQIADKEGTTQRAIVKSLYAAREKLKIFFLL